MPINIDEKTRMVFECAHEDAAKLEALTMSIIDAIEGHQRGTAIIACLVSAMALGKEVLAKEEASILLSQSLLCLGKE